MYRAYPSRNLVLALGRTYNLPRVVSKLPRRSGQVEGALFEKRGSLSQGVPTYDLACWLRGHDVSRRYLVMIIRRQGHENDKKKTAPWKVTKLKKKSCIEYEFRALKLTGAFIKIPYPYCTAWRCFNTLPLPLRRSTGAGWSVAHGPGATTCSAWRSTSGSSTIVPSAR